MVVECSPHNFGMATLIGSILLIDEDMKLNFPSIITSGSVKKKPDLLVRNQSFGIRLEVNHKDAFDKWSMMR